MTDRELLELAAKAAGYQVAWNENWNCFQHRNPVPDKFGSCRHPWVPLEDDGDALRLAVKLNISLRADAESAESQTSFEGGWPVFNDAEKWVQLSDVSEDARYFATRRVIVRSAAAIGKTMP